MKNFLLSVFVFIFLLSCSSDEESASPQSPSKTSIKYKVEVMMHWSKTNFPTNFPSNDHFSPLVGWVHNTSTTFFDEGTIASKGIKIMAETGGVSALQSEIESKIAEGEGYKLISGSGLSSGEGVITVEIDVTKENSLITLATMIAPSPDWYVALVDANLYENGKFTEQKTFEAFAFDAGTDSGVDYVSANAITNPRESIKKITSSPFNTGKTIATVKFTKM